MSSISTFDDQQEHKQFYKEHELDSINREHKVILNPVRDVQYDVNLSTNVTVQHQTPREDFKDGTQTCREQLTSAALPADSMIQKSPIGELLTIHMTDKGDKGHHTPIKRLKTLKRDNGNIPAFERHISIDAPAEGCKTSFEDDSDTVNSENAAYSNPVGKKSVCMDSVANDPWL